MLGYISHPVEVGLTLHLTLKNVLNVVQPMLLPVLYVHLKRVISFAKVHLLVLPSGKKKKKHFFWLL